MRVSSIYRPVPLVMILALSVGAGHAEDPTYPQEDPRPCQIMIDQVTAYAKSNPGHISGTYFTDWNDALSRESPDKYFMQRAFQPGRGKAFFYQPTIGGDVLKQTLERKGWSFSPKSWYAKFQDIEYQAKKFYENPWLQFYDLTDHSDILVINENGGTAFCTHSEPYRLDKETRQLVGEKGTFMEGDLCDPADFAMVNIEGKDYYLGSSTFAHGDESIFNLPEGHFGFEMVLIASDGPPERAVCEFGLLFKIIGDVEDVESFRHFGPPYKVRRAYISGMEGSFAGETSIFRERLPWFP